MLALHRAKWHVAQPPDNAQGRAGSIHTVYDLLLRYNVHIVGEKFEPIRHCLLANHGVQRADLIRVLSDPQALAQCDDYLHRMEVVKEAVDDTAGALLLSFMHNMRRARAYTAWLACANCGSLHSVSIAMPWGMSNRRGLRCRLLVVPLLNMIAVTL